VFNYKEWYEKNKEKQKIWQQEYYRKNREHILEMHKDWAKKNVDHTGSVWRLYGRRRRNKNPNIDKEYRLRKKARVMYKPLPESLTIKQSGISGLGLFADQDIKQATNLGVTHIKLDDKIIRTPLGGFINHSNEPNCAKVGLHANGHEPIRKKWNLVTLKDIKKGEEITLRYTFYNI
jgi:hypothetical protein